MDGQNDLAIPNDSQCVEDGSISFPGARWDATNGVCNGGIRLRIDDLDRLSIYLPLLLSLSFSFSFSLLPSHSIRCVNDPTQVREKEAALRSQGSFAQVNYELSDVISCNEKIISRRYT